MVQCPSCNRQQSDDVIFCDCGYNLEEYREQLREKNAQRENASRPYQWLPIFRIVLRIAGVLTLITGVIYVFGLYAEAESFGLLLLGLAATVIAAVPAFAFAEIISVLLDLHGQNGQILSRLERAERVRSGPSK